MKHYTLDRRAVVALREAKGWSQTQLAKLVDISGPAMSQFESGAAQPSAETASKIARTLGVPFSKIATVKEAAEIAEAS